MHDVSKIEPNTTNPFRNKGNVRLLRGLFFETGGSEGAVYTLRDFPHTYEGRTYPSLYQHYMDEEDLTEYNFAKKYLESWEHWDMIKDTSWFKPYIQRWRTELELKIKSRALKNIQAEAAGQTKSSFNANKWLAEKGWIPKEVEPSRRGRPSKAEINKIAHEEAMSLRDIQADLKRMELN